MKILVCVKQVPTAAEEPRFTADGTIDRGASDSQLSELDEYAIEQALKIAESGADAEITYLTVGPDSAKDTLRKALAMGGHSAIHIADDAVQGSDAPATALILAKAVDRHGFDLVMCGMASTDGAMGAVPVMLAEHLGVPAVTYLDEIRVEGTKVSGRRENENATLHLEAELPAVVSVTDRSGEARYPSFKGIMAAKKKPLESLSLADLGIDPAQVGLPAARSAVDSVTKRPPRTQGEIVTDEGDGGKRLAEFLTAKKFI
ncbi:electron transfer flavoprotein subunit beta/FixA family protein [Nonomuraea wenchangensis]|uniref:electron transfer flavoprotein subunit beta/FixA family protein n=1 Tax=Nonomuraea wenchangensis TaxID=568860 RepID=UPI003428B573